MVSLVAGPSSFPSLLVVFAAELVRLGVVDLGPLQLAGQVCSAGWYPVNAVWHFAAAVELTYYAVLPLL